MEQSRTVTVPLAQVREEARRDALLADELLCGTSGMVLEERLDGWVRFCADHRYSGWVLQAQLGCTGKGSHCWRDAPKLMVLPPCTDLMRYPQVRSIALITLPHGSLVQPWGGVPREDDWQLVLTAGGLQGYLRNSQLAPYPLGTGLEEDALRQSILASAQCFAGSSYRWGGRTPLGVDCSGLVSQCYLDHGITLWRDSALAPGFAAHPIPCQALRPADLLYWKGHVALYLGAQRYLHANATYGGVCVNSLDPTAADYRRDLAESIAACGSVF